MPDSWESVARGAFIATLPKEPKSDVTFWHELVSANPRLIKSTCAYCSDSTIAPTFEQLDEWERGHDCRKTVSKLVSKLSLLKRLRLWLFP